jgi:hypothetical protein
MLLELFKYIIEEPEQLDEILRKFFSNFTVKTNGVGKKQRSDVTYKLNEPWEGFVKSDSFVHGRAFPLMLEPRGESIFMHDVHPAILMAQLLGSGPMVYECQPVVITYVPHTHEERERFGEIDAVIGQAGSPERFVATGLDSDLYRETLFRVVGNGNSVGEHYLISTDPDGKEHHGVHHGGDYLTLGPIYEHCARCGYVECNTHPTGWRHPCKREHAEERVRGYDPALAAVNGWAYYWDGNVWVAAPDYTTAYWPRCC